MRTTLSTILLILATTGAMAAEGRYYNAVPGAPMILLHNGEMLDISAGVQKPTDKIVGYTVVGDVTYAIYQQSVVGGPVYAVAQKTS